ncbi:MAG: hypothetical protein HYU28_03065 [Actinobacteria bacterium]|nr:hypothetical protein [Actinomycetota bacterium]
MTRLRPASVALALACVAGLADPLPAAPRQEGTEVSAARLSLAGIPAWVQLGSEVNIDLRVEPATPGLEVTAILHDRIRSRASFGRTTEGESLGDSIGSITAPVADLAPGPTGAPRLAFTTAAPAPPAPQGEDPEEGASTEEGEGAEPPLPSMTISQEGVYPLELRLQVAGSSTVTDRLVTYVVTLDPANSPSKLSVAWVWPMAIDAPRRPNGQVSTSLRDAVDPAGSLAQLTDALAAVPDVPVTIAPRPATLDAWAELAGAAPPDATSTSGPAPADPAVEAALRLATLRAQAALATRQVLAGTYARVDLAALAKRGLDEEISAQVTEGADLLRTTLAIRPDPRTFLAGGALGEDALALLRTAGVDRLVLPREALVPIFEQLTPARPVEIESGLRSFSAASGDPELAEGLARGADDPTSDVEAAQRLLAGLSVVALEAPGEKRGVVVTPPSTWTPTTGLLVTALRGLAGHPALEAVTIDGFFANVPAAEGEPGARVLEDGGRGRLALTSTTVEGARRRITSLAAMLPEGSVEPVVAGRRLLLAQAEPFQRGNADPSAADYLAGVDALINSVLGSVRLPASAAVTLTAQRGRVPITLVNDSGSPLRVRLRFTSDKLLFPDGTTFDVELPPRSTTERFTVEARTSGSFPMLVEVLSPDGQLQVGTFEMTIRSTAVSGVALTLTIGAGVFLVGWWGNHVRKARRRRREDAALDESNQ